jgi:hypothetical protein
VACVSAASGRFPVGCPTTPGPSSSRCGSSSLNRESRSVRARRQLRASPGGNTPKLLPQPPQTSAVVCDGNNSGHAVWIRLAPLKGQIREPFQHRGQSRASTERHDVVGARCLRFSEESGATWLATCRGRANFLADWEYHSGWQMATDVPPQHAFRSAGYPSLCKVATDLSPPKFSSRAKAESAKKLWPGSFTRTARAGAHPSSQSIAPR